MTSGHRKVLRRALLLLLGVTLAVALSEAGLRLYGRATGTDYSAYARALLNPHRLPDGLFRDEAGLTVLTPGFRGVAATSDFKVPYEIDASGMRAGGRATGQARGRVVALGDSFTFGEGVPAGRTFTTLLAQELGSDLLNLGVPGYGAGQALALYLRRGKELDHDLVLLFFAATLHRRRHLEPGDPVMDRTARRPTAHMPASDPLLAPAPWATDRLHLVSYLTYHLRAWQLGRRLEQVDRAKWGAPAARRRRDTRRTMISDPALDARMVTILRRLAAAAGERPLVVVNIEPGGTFPLFDELKGALTYIDLSEDLRRAAERGPLRFKIDRHYAPDTHALIAGALSPRLAPLLPQR